jgi:hypothetical protein
MLVHSLQLYSLFQKNTIDINFSKRVLSASALHSQHGLLARIQDYEIAYLWLVVMK